MIPRIAEINVTQKLYLDFIESLKNSHFEGEVNPDYASRVVLSTDNSIYQVLPQGVVFPKSVEDLVLLAGLAAEPRFKDVVLSARGGGTGTNGQSLTDGWIVDISRPMNQRWEERRGGRGWRVGGGSGAGCGRPWGGWGGGGRGGVRGRGGGRRGWAQMRGRWAEREHGRRHLAGSARPPERYPPFFHIDGGSLHG